MFHFPRLLSITVWVFYFCSSQKGPWNNKKKGSGLLLLHFLWVYVHSRVSPCRTSVIPKKGKKNGVNTTLFLYIYIFFPLFQITKTILLVVVVLLLWVHSQPPPLRPPPPSSSSASNCCCCKCWYTKVIFLTPVVIILLNIECRKQWFK